MKLIDQKVELIDIPNNNSKDELVKNIFKHIEKVARTCYKSEDRITEDSCIKMVDFLIKHEHYGPLRHGTIYLQIPKVHILNQPFRKNNKNYWNEVNEYRKSKENFKIFKKTLKFYKNSHFSRVNYNNNMFYITTNYLVLLQNNRLDDLQYIVNPTKYHSLRTTFKFTTQLSINREIQTHDGQFGRARAEESTRYCNYTKGKFDNELTFIYPLWMLKEEKEAYFKIKNNDSTCIYKNYTKRTECFINSLIDAEKSYFNCIKNDLQPQNARYVLPLGVKSELNYTLFDSDWKYVFDIRQRPGVHPDLKPLIKDTIKLFNNK